MTELWTNALRQKMVKARNAGMGSGAPAAARVAMRSPRDSFYQSVMEYNSKRKGGGDEVDPRGDWVDPGGDWVDTGGRT